MTFSPKDYWDGHDGRPGRGRTYEAEAIAGGWWDGEQEHLPDLLQTLEFDSVLEVGCGFGRVGASIMRRWPTVDYTGIDISLELVEAARKRLPAAEIIWSDMVTFESPRRWDLILAISSLSHIPPEDIGEVVAKLKAWAVNDIVVVDWNAIGSQTAYQFGHDVAELLGPDTERVSVNGPGQTAEDGRMAMWHLRL